MTAPPSRPSGRLVCIRPLFQRVKHFFPGTRPSGGLSAYNQTARLTNRLGRSFYFAVISKRISSSPPFLESFQRKITRKAKLFVSPPKCIICIGGADSGVSSLNHFVFPFRVSNISSYFQIQGSNGLELNENYSSKILVGQAIRR